MYKMSSFVQINLWVSLLVWVHALVVTHVNMEMNLVMWLPCLTPLLLNRVSERSFLLSCEENRWILLIYLWTIRTRETIISTYLGLNFFYALKMLSQIIRLKGFYSTKGKVYVIAGLLIRDRIQKERENKKLLLLSLSLPEQDLKTNCDVAHILC